MFFFSLQQYSARMSSFFFAALLWATGNSIGNISKEWRGWWNVVCLIDERNLRRKTTLTRMLFSLVFSKMFCSNKFTLNYTKRPCSTALWQSHYHFFISLWANRIHRSIWYWYKNWSESDSSNRVLTLTECMNTIGTEQKQRRIQEFSKESADVIQMRSFRGKLLEKRTKSSPNTHWKML